MKNRTVSAKDLNRISAYLDGQLSRSEAQRLEDQFRKDALLKQTYLELKQTRILLKHAKTRPVPRNFTLTPEMAAQIKPAKRPFVIPALSVSSALAVLVLVFAILFEVFPSSNLAQFAQNPVSEKFIAEEMAPMASAPMAESLQSDQAFAEDSTARGIQDLQGNPPIINWGGQSYQSGGGAYGMGGGMGGGGSIEEPAITTAEESLETPLEGEGELPLEETTPQEEFPTTEAPPSLVVPDLPIPSKTTPTPDAQTASGGGGEEPQATETPPVTREAELFEKSNAEPLSGSGPILGVRSAEEAQIYNETVLEILANEKEAYQRAQNRIPLIRLVQIGAGTLALLTGLTAFWINRKTRL